MVPSTVVMPREGSLALAFFGRVRNVHEPTFSLAAGRKSFALKRILEAVLVISLTNPQPYQRDRAEPPLAGASAANIENCFMEYQNVNFTAASGWTGQGVGPAELRLVKKTTQGLERFMI